MANNEKLVKDLTGKIGRLLDLMTTVENPAPYQRQIAEMEAERDGLVAELSRQQAQADLDNTAVRISEEDVRGAGADCSTTCAPRRTMSPSFGRPSPLELIGWKWIRSRSGV